MLLFRPASSTVVNVKNGIKQAKPSGTVRKDTNWILQRKGGAHVTTPSSQRSCHNACRLALWHRGPREASLRPEGKAILYRGRHIERPPPQPHTAPTVVHQGLLLFSLLLFTRAYCCSVLLARPTVVLLLLLTP